MTTELLGKLYTGAVADTLDDMGYHNQCLPSDIRPLAETMKVAGPAYTVPGRPRRDPAFVLDDVLNEKVSLECALEEYGVAIDSIQMAVNEKETMRLRKAACA